MAVCKLTVDFVLVSQLWATCPVPLEFYCNLNQLEQKIQNEPHATDTIHCNENNLFIIRANAHVNFTKTASTNSASDSVLVVHQTGSHGGS